MDGPGLRVLVIVRLRGGPAAKQKQKSKRQ